MDERYQYTMELFERAYLPFFAWACEQGSEVFLQAYTCVFALAEVQRGTRLMRFQETETPDYWDAMRAAATLRDMAREAGFVLLADICEQSYQAARAAAVGVGSLFAVIALG